MSLRIIAGQFKGRILKAPKGPVTRPTQGMLREAVFNICQQVIEGASFLDLFAGSGAMGLEALSRGAAHATFVEGNRFAAQAIRDNIALLDLGRQSSLIVADAKAALRRLKGSFNLIYVDPPYDLKAAPFVEELLSSGLLADDGILFLEERSLGRVSPPTFASLILVGSRKFGEATLHQYRSV